MVSIWASILGFDPSCRQELVRDKMQGYFIQYLQAKERDMPSAQRCMAAFVLAEICNGYKDGQHSCLQQGLHRTCTGILKSFLDVTPASQLVPPPGMGGPIPGVGIQSPSLRVPSAIPVGDPAQDSNCKVWVALCLFKLCEDFPYAKYLIFTEVTDVRLSVYLLCNVHQMLSLSPILIHMNALCICRLDILSCIPSCKMLM